ncbi:MAG TPA: hypothetical protein VFR81_13825 [Longimicrobium sp.]|nr:hypothetical protein [Longimicrobium sp.]
MTRRARRLPARGPNFAERGAGRRGFIVHAGTTWGRIDIDGRDGGRSARR